MLPTRVSTWAALLFAVAVGAAACSSSQQSVTVRNVDGPSVNVSIAGTSLGTVKCGETKTWSADAGASPPPWHVDVTKLDGSAFGAADAGSGAEVRIRTDGVVSGPPNGALGPAAAPCSQS